MGCSPILVELTHCTQRLCLFLAFDDPEVASDLHIDWVLERADCSAASPHCEGHKDHHLVLAHISLQLQDRVYHGSDKKHDIFALRAILSWR